ncbi:thiamine-phosphate kinase [Propionicicella superfundia]|uniref:thiamine-phosphate kinase n=1 Tax=Propionicicella superfundia TaxID=348582 RepID=UPI0003FEC0E3|nr:thiamine-phosphate kinase [Propionicicella superfundia]
MSEPTVSSVGEFGLIDLVTAGVGERSEVPVGVGDDATVYTLGGAGVCSTDAMVEGVHFRRDWSSAADVGRKAVAEAAADLEAMAADPVLAVVSASLPKDLPLSWAVECMAGARAECERAGLLLAGGDTTSARDVTLVVTVLGDLHGRAPVLRSGARPGDVVAFHGRLGWAAAGLAVLSRGFRSPRAVVEAHRVPEIPYGQGRVAAEAGATAMLDVSDGLLADLRHIADASGVCIDVTSAALPLPEPIRTVGTALGTDPLGYVLTGGEDHALAACFPPGAAPEGWIEIGSVMQGDPAVAVDGVVWEGSGGWNHFA